MDKSTNEDNCKQIQTIATNHSDKVQSTRSATSTSVTEMCTSTSTSLCQPFTQLDNILAKSKPTHNKPLTFGLKSYSTSTTARVTVTSDNPFDYKAPLDITTEDILNTLFPCTPPPRVIVTSDNPFDYKAPLDITNEDVLNTLFPCTPPAKQLTSGRFTQDLTHT